MILRKVEVPAKVTIVNEKLADCCSLITIEISKSVVNFSCDGMLITMSKVCFKGAIKLMDEALKE